MNGSVYGVGGLLLVALAKIGGGLVVVKVSGGSVVVMRCTGFLIYGKT